MATPTSITSSNGTSSWFNPNYVDPEVKDHYLVPVLAMLMALSGIIFFLRFISRGYVLRSLGADDWMMLPALITAYGLSILECRTEYNGWGRHLWDIEPKNWSIIRKESFTTQLLFTYSIAITKISILIFYFRFCTTKKFKWAIIVTLTGVVAWTISMTCLVIFQCTPVNEYWREIKLTEYRHGCLPNEANLTLLHGTLNVFFDILVLVLPIPVVLKLQLPRRQKIGLVAMFGLGLIVCFAGILRIVSMQKVVMTSDTSWYGYDLWIYTSTEAHVAIICASIPSLKPLVIRIFPRFASSAYANGSAALTGPYQKADDFGGERNGKSYPMTSIMTSRHDRMGSEETIIGTNNSTDEINRVNVVKTTEIEVTVHRNEPFR